MHRYSPPRKSRRGLLGEEDFNRSAFHRVCPQGGQHHVFVQVQRDA